ncbi:MAG: hypothetical protein ABSD90_16920 [Methylocystis sp.]|jgi:hypothetical protein
MLTHAQIEPRPSASSELFSRGGGVTLGRDRFAQISAVEGIALTQEMRATLDHFDREGLSAEERRRAIVRRFAPAV